DERFRPCAIEPGPDGAIYIVDMYRGIVQDAPHMSPYLREISVERKMESPIHFGRIWRIVPEDFRQPEPPDFAALSPPELVALLSHESGWWRDRAQTYLVESNLVEAIPGLIELIDNSDDEWARLHSLWTLEGLLSNLNAINGSGISDSDWLTSTLDDPSPTLRAAALRILPEIGVPHEILAQEIEYRANEDFSPEETLQAILTLGDLDLPSSQKTRLISLLISPIVADPLCRDAALSSLAEQEISFLEQVWDSLPEDKASSPGWEFMLEALAVAGLSRGHPDEVGRLIARLETSEPTWKEAALFASIKALRNDLMAEPIALSKAPSGLNRYPDLAAYFSWPGHTPEPLAISGVEPLDKQERIRFARGRQIYMTSCVACHGSDGGGMKYLAPPLAGSDWVNGSEERLVRILLHGLSGPISVSGKRYEFPEIQAVMPPLAGLDNAEIAAVLTYIRLEWGNTANPISAGDVGQIRIASQGRTIPWTESELQVSQFQAHLPHKKAPDNK
ncbi:MAG: c-type cytochrome, partial [Verrucomicrobiota bacterium]